ncbi:hypothetical protein [Undibacterium sp. TJN19]|uniref:hypothetical protein n=1 Tax=Undibacterium sp. TJN19 TaxID=3413055 RepID=UPI003BF25A35
MTHINVDQGAYDPTTGSAATNEASTSLKGLVEDYNRQSDGAAFVSGLVLEGDKKITIAAAALTVVPAPGDRITFDTSDMTIKNVKTTFAGDLPALYELHARN